jgi:hypothetical protein
MDISLVELNEILKEMYEENYFRVRKGINGYLLFKKIKKPTQK